MATESIPARIKRLREAKGLSKYRLAQQSGIRESYIGQLEAGKVSYPRGNTLAALAKGLGVDTSVFFDDASARSLKTLLHEAQQKYNAMELLEIPVRGAVPAGYPFPAEEQTGEFIEVPRQEIGSNPPEKLYAVKISGDSLQGDEIYSGDFAVVNKEAGDIIDGKIYIVRLGNEVCARHVFKLDDSLRLASSNGEYKEMLANEVEILGRLILTGRWKRH